MSDILEEVEGEGDDISGAGGIFWFKPYCDIAQYRDNSYRVCNMAGCVLLVLEGVPEGIIRQYYSTVAVPRNIQ